MAEIRCANPRRRADDAAYGPVHHGAMPETSPIRRYVLLRHRDHSSPLPRWSMERVAAAPSAPAPAPVVAPRRSQPSPRA